ncbi:hypothetical protein EZV73_23780 [Acidaminobacter sp. JC074]|uniref:DUF5305 family protein n=1 Tax=Acidaminobacter sp. JC074 TaxID=2530199 RepID=UPI001F10972F|nr:DUF5305 family protein [Acidaminobacter sp. JC074]MCH4890623.1 hypothetical protein [Acidaminobacter sp. JC074]
MKKIYLDRKIKISIIVVILLILAFLVFKVYSINSKETFTEEIKTIYSYEWEENIEWTSHLIDNPIIKEKKLDKTRFIFKDLTDEITLNFNVPITTSDQTSFEGDAMLVGTLKSIYGNEKELVWQETLSLEEVDITNKENTIVFDVSVVEDIKSIKDELDLLDEEFSLPGDYILVYELAVDGELVSNEERYDFKINPQVEFSIMSSLTKGLETLSETMTFSKEETVQIPLDTNRDNLSSYYIAIVVLILILIIVTVFTKSKSSKDAFDKLVDSLLKEYGDRMVRLPKSLSLQYGNVMNIENEKDMIKTADEINQPVFYYYNNEAEERKLEMFIFDDTRVYYYNKFGVLE